jgi:hypothetical protein
MRIEGHITIWFNENSMFKMEFNRVNIVDALGMLQLIRNVLTGVSEPQDIPHTEVADEAATQAEGA